MPATSAEIKKKGGGVMIASTDFSATRGDNSDLADNNHVQHVDRYSVCDSRLDHVDVESLLVCFWRSSELPLEEGEV
jgi:hypothetical protein